MIERNTSGSHSCLANWLVVRWTSHVAPAHHQSVFAPAICKSSHRHTYRRAPSITLFTYLRLCTGHRGLVTPSGSFNIRCVRMSNHLLSISTQLTCDPCFPCGNVRLLSTRNQGDYVLIPVFSPRRLRSGKVRSVRTQCASQLLYNDCIQF